MIPQASILLPKAALLWLTIAAVLAFVPHPATAVIKLGTLEDLVFNEPLKNLTLGIRAGLEAAFAEQNTRGGIKGHQIQIVKLDADFENYTEYGLKAEELLALHPDITAFAGTLGNQHITEMTGALKKRGLLHLSPFSSDLNPRFYDPTNVFVRADPLAEMVALVTQISHRFRLKSVAVMHTLYTGFGGPPIDEMTQMARTAGIEWSYNFAYDYRSNAECPKNLICKAVVAQQGNGTWNLISELTTFLLTEPDAVVVLSGLGSDTIEFVVGVLTHPLSKSHAPNIKFFVTEQLALLVQVLFDYVGEDPSGRIFSTFTFPIATDRSFDVIRNYQRSMELAYGAAWTSYEGYTAVGGYVVGRWIVNVLDKAANLTAPAIYEAVYRSSIFEVDDLTFGVFKDSCPGKRVSACECNDGSMRVDMGVYDKKNYWQAVEGTSYEWPMSTCGGKSLKIVRPTNYVQVVQPDDPVSVATSALMVAGLRAAESSSSLDPVPGDVTRVNDTTSGSFSSQVTTLNRTLLTTAMIASTIDTKSVSQLPWPVVDPFVPRASASGSFNRFVLQTSTSLEQEIHSAVAFASSRGAGSLVLVAPTSNIGTIATAHEKSCVTFSIDKGTSSFVDGSLASHAAGFGSGYYFVTGIRSSADAIAVARATSSGAAVIIAQNEYGTWYTSLVDEVVAGRANGANIFVATHLPSWAPSTTSDIAREYRGTLASGADAHPLTFRAFVSTRAAISVVSSITRDAITDTRFLSTWYDISTIVLGNDLVLGPFFDAPCGEGSSANCECNVGPRALRLQSLDSVRTNVSAETAAAFEHDFTSCQIGYTEPEESSLSTAAIIGIAVGGVAALLIGVVVFTRVTRTNLRDTSFAPKDASKPYTLVFTDIQSSTSLWARVPDDMGPALDTHHAIIRKLIRKHKGYEVKTIGDAFMIAFVDSHDAVKLCRDLQQEFFDFEWGTDAIDETYKQLENEAAEDNPKAERPSASLPDPLYRKMWSGLRVRCGIHTGIGDIKFDEITRGYDYYGNVPNTAARTEASAHGGQVVMTKATSDTLGDAFTLTDLGPVTLRGVPEPVQLFQLPAIDGRIFAALRVEVDEDDDTESSFANTSTTSDPNTTNVEAISINGSEGSGGHLTAAVNKRKAAVKHTIPFDEGLQVLFSMGDASAVNSSLSEIAKRWRVRVNNASSLSTDKTKLNAEIINGLTRRVVGVYRSRKGGGRYGGGLSQHGSIAGSVRNSPQPSVGPSPATANLPGVPEGPGEKYTVTLN